MTLPIEAASAPSSEFFAQTANNSRQDVMIATDPDFLETYELESATACPPEVND